MYSLELGNKYPTISEAPRTTQTGSPEEMALLGHDANLQHEIRGIGDLLMRLPKLVGVLAGFRCLLGIGSVLSTRTF